MTRRIAWSALLAAMFSLASVSAAMATPAPDSQSQSQSRSHSRSQTQPHSQSQSPPSCPSGTARIASHSGIRINRGQARATVDFAVAEGCHDIEVSLASYRLGHASPDSGQEHQQVLFDAHTGHFNPGEVHQLTVAVDPDCYVHVMLVLGAPVEWFGPEDSFEQERERTVDSKLDGAPHPCAAPQPRHPDAAPTSTSSAPPATTAPPSGPAGSPTTTVPTATKAPAPATAPPEPNDAAGAEPTTTVPAAPSGADPPEGDPPAGDPPVAPLVVAPTTSDPGSLPFTGTSLVTLFVTGLFLLASGLLLLAVNRAGSR